MNTQNRVFNVIKKEEKVELATQKVELGNLKDFKAKNKVFEKSIQDFTSDIVDIVNSKDAARKKFTKLANDFAELDSEYQSFRKAVLDLGVEMPQKIESDYKIATQIMKQSQKDYRELVR